MCKKGEVSHLVRRHSLRVFPPADVVVTVFVGEDFLKVLRYMQRTSIVGVCDIADLIYTATGGGDVAAGLNNPMLYRQKYW